jgi:hypothetical protein
MNNPQISAGRGVLLSRDLMFVSKITGTATVLGFRVDVIASLDQFQVEVRANPPRAVFLDLNCAEFVPEVVVASIEGPSRSHVIAFGSHVDTARLAAAKKAGCDEVLPRSQFSAMLPELLRKSFAETG